MRLNKKVFGEKEFFIGIFAVVFGGFLLMEKDKNPELYQIYPRVIFTALIIIGVLMAGKALLQSEEKNKKGTGVTAPELIILAFLLIVRPAMEFLGIYSTLYVVCMAIGLLLEKERTMKHVGKLACYNLALTAVLYVAFTVLLRVNMPKGLLF
nr:tripartite tricarboxylate transporter TctB family protein [Clostridium sp. MCC353]